MSYFLSLLLYFCSRKGLHCSAAVSSGIYALKILILHQKVTDYFHGYVLIIFQDNVTISALNSHFMMKQRALYLLT